MSLLRTDRRLLEAFRSGERAALEKVYWHYVDSVAHVVRRGVVLSRGRRVTGLPAHEISDLVQETFLRAFAEKTRLAYDGLRDYRPFLLTICRNLVVDWARRRGREVPTEEELTTTVETDGGASIAASEPEWADALTLTVVEAYVRSLTPPISEVYEQRYVRGRSEREAAEALGIGRQTVRTLEKHLRSGLRQAIEAAF